MDDSWQFPLVTFNWSSNLALQCGGHCLHVVAVRVVQKRYFNRPARRAQAQTRAQRGIRADERLRRTPYRGFLRKPGDYLLRPVAYPRSNKIAVGTAICDLKAVGMIV